MLLVRSVAEKQVERFLENLTTRLPLQYQVGLVGQRRRGTREIGKRPVIGPRRNLIQTK